MHLGVSAGGWWRSTMDMQPTLTMPTHTEYRIERGGVPRPIYGVKKRIDRETHDLVIEATEKVSSIIEPELRHWAYDLRRGKLRIYGGLLRFIDLLHRRGRTEDEAMKIVSWIAAYIHETWAESKRAA